MSKPTTPIGTVLVMGATSSLARAVAVELARAGAALVLAARDAAELDAIAADLRVRYAVSVHVRVTDVTDDAAQAALADDCQALAGAGALGLIYFSGLLADQRAAEHDTALARRVIDVNFTSAAALIGRFADLPAVRPDGCLAAVSSVAGDRGRQSNYLYGSAKAGLTVFMDGLRHRLFRNKTRVVCIKLGFTDTAMTWGFINPKSPMTVSPAAAARQIVGHFRSRSGTYYVPARWRAVMAVIRGLPAPIFHRTRL